MQAAIDDLAAQANKIAMARPACLGLIRFDGHS
jgi:hypothetical protein